MGNIVLQGATSGSTTLTPTDAVTTTVTFPSLGGTAMVSGNMPAFSAYMSAGQALTQNTSILLPFNTKSYDTATCFNNTGSTVTLNGISVPAYAFAPNVAGYYQISAGWAGAAPSAPTDYSVTIRKNGTDAISCGGYSGSSSYTVRPSASGLLYMNGTSDYVAVYAYVGQAQTTQSGSSVTIFCAALVRTA